MTELTESEEAQTSCAVAGRLDQIVMLRYYYTKILL